MVTMNYLKNSANIVVKNFIVREDNDALAMTLCGRSKDLMTKYGGALLFERKLLDGVYYMIVSFGSPDLMTAWEATLGRKEKMHEVTNSKILIVRDTEGNMARATARCNEAKELLTKCKGAVLREMKVTEGAYQLILFFSDKTQMQVWEETLKVS